MPERLLTTKYKKKMYFIYQIIPLELCVAFSCIHYC